MDKFKITWQDKAVILCFICLLIPTIKFYTLYLPYWTGFIPFGLYVVYRLLSWKACVEKDGFAAAFVFVIAFGDIIYLDVYFTNYIISWDGRGYGLEFVFKMQIGILISLLLVSFSRMMRRNSLLRD